MILNFVVLKLNALNAKARDILLITTRRKTFVITANVLVMLSLNAPGVLGNMNSHCE